MTLLNTGILKPETEAEIEKLGLTAEKVADRWLGGWKKRTLELEKSGELLWRLKERAEREASVLVDARMGGENSYLADHELAELYGISMNEGPP